MSPALLPYGLLPLLLSIIAFGCSSIGPPASMPSFVETVGKLERRLTTLFASQGYLSLTSAVGLDSLASLYTMRYRDTGAASALRSLRTSRNAALAGRLGAGDRERAHVLAAIMLENVERQEFTYHIVVRSNVPFYTDSARTSRRTDVHGVFVRSSHDSATAPGNILATTRPDKYRPGMAVSWEWSWRTQWNDALWFLDSASGESRWLKSIEFAGVAIDPGELWSTRSDTIAGYPYRFTSDPLSAGGQLIDIARTLEGIASRIHGDFGLGESGRTPSRAEIASAMVKGRLFSRADSIVFMAALTLSDSLQRGGERNSWEALAWRDRALELSRRMPHSYQIALIDTSGVDIYSDAGIESIRDDVKGVLLRITGYYQPEWKLVPTTDPSRYRRGTFVVLERSGPRSWGPSWFVHPMSGRIVRTWDSTEPEFIGRLVGNDE